MIYDRRCELSSFAKKNKAKIVRALDETSARTKTVALTHTNGDPPDLGFSPHVDGALCADLFRGCDVVLDLANDRVAVVQRER